MGVLDGKVAAITGGSRGIGRVTAELFAHEGAALALCGRTQATLDAAAKEIAARHGARVFAQVADIMENASVGRFAEAVEREFGRADILVNNAGESSQRAVDGVNWPVNAVDAPGQKLPAGRFESITDEEWREALEQKVLGMIRVTRAFLPLLRKGRGAAIVNITSIKGRQPPPRVVTSGVAWAASMNFSKGLSIELAGEDIRVNVVSRRRHPHRADGGGTPQVGAGEVAGGIPCAARGQHSAGAPRHDRGSRARDSVPRLATRELRHRPVPVGGRRRRAHDLIRKTSDEMTQ